MTYRHVMQTLVLGVGILATAVHATAQSTSAAPPATVQEQPPRRFPPPGWPSPVEDRRPYTLLLADVVDFTSGGDLHWDSNGWHGGDYNRIWFKSEGEQSLQRAERNLDVQVLYGRFVKKFYDAQIGGGVQTATYEGRNVTRGELVLGLEGFVPFKSDFESLLFVSTDGDVRGRVTFERDLLLGQRLIMQPRIESNIAAQAVEEFGVGRGLNNLELKLRVRYEFRREFAPYVGVSFWRQFFGTADLTRARGSDPSSLRLLFGLRAWR